MNQCAYLVGNKHERIHIFFLGGRGGWGGYANFRNLNYSDEDGGQGWEGFGPQPTS